MYRKFNTKEREAKCLVVERSGTNSGGQKNGKRKGFRNIGMGISDGGCDTNKEDTCKIT